jgi:hypothetical protein
MTGEQIYNLCILGIITLSALAGLWLGSQRG